MTVFAPLVGGARAVERELDRRGNPALDLDLTPRSPARAAVGVLSPAALQSCTPASVWLPEGALGQDPAASGFIIPAGWSKQRPPLVVIDLPPLPEGRFSEFVQVAAAAERYRKATGGRVALALRARHLEGGRRHLAQLSLLRRSLEEWGLPVALDLSGPFEPQWEAEAAILRLSGRIAIVRVGASALSPGALDRARVARRALRAALELHADLPVAIAADGPWWRRIVGDDRIAWGEAVARLEGYRRDARHIEPPPQRGSRRSPKPFNPSGLI